MVTYSFAETTSIHGIRYLFINKQVIRLIWRLLVTGITAFCLKQVVNTINVYRKFETKTTQTEINFDSVAFPAATLCSNQVYLRHEMGTSLDVLAGIYFSSSNVLDYKMTKDFCYYPNASRFYNITDNLYGDVEFMRTTQVDSFKGVKGCYLNGKPFDCGKYFLNKATEFGWCFTFNSGSEILKSYKIAEETPNVSLANAYGTESTFTSNLRLNGVGRRNSVSLLILFNESDACIPIDLLSGTYGYSMLIHDPNSEPYMSKNLVVKLTPGFVTNIDIRFRRTIRYTENLGYCHSHYPLKYFPQVTQYTSKDTYIINCLSEKVATTCKCAGYLAPPSVREINNFTQFVCGVPVSQLNCFNAVMQEEYYGGRSCFKNVPIPCEESGMYHYQTTAKFPTPKLFQHYQRELTLPETMSYEEFRGNFILVNFYVSSKQTAMFEEFQKMTWVDLMNQLGGTIGMCLGMSIVSIAELFAYLANQLRNFVGTDSSRLFRTTVFQRLFYTP